MASTPDGGGEPAPDAPRPGHDATALKDAPDGAPTGADAGEEHPEASTDGGARRPRRLRAALEWVTVLAIALAVALFVRTYVVQTYYIPSASMEPTLEIGDHILVLKAAYRFSAPSVGDIVVFHAPPPEHTQCQDPNVQDLVKRVVATPNDTIWSTGNTIYVNGEVLKQPWQHTVQLGQSIRRTKVPPNQYFVMGDNRPNSCDSRDWGTVPRADIIGKAVLIFWPPSRIGTL